MPDYKPNSHRYREGQDDKVPEKRVDKVVKGGVRTRKKTGISKLAGVFISDDVNNVGEYLVMDILVPTLKKAALSTLDMILNGGTPTYTGRSERSKVTYRSYGSYYDEPRERRGSASVRTRFDYDDIVFDSRGDAEAVLDEMINVLDRYKCVTVADLYDLAELTQPYTSKKYGWTSLRTAEVVRLNGGGYIIKLPKACPID